MRTVRLLNRRILLWLFLFSVYSASCSPVGQNRFSGDSSIIQPNAVRDASEAVVEPSGSSGTSGPNEKVDIRTEKAEEEEQQTEGDSKLNPDRFELMAGENKKADIHLLSFEWVKSRDYIYISFALLLAVVAKICYNNSPLNHRAPESCVFIAMGVIAGGTYQWLSEALQGVADADAPQYILTSTNFFYIFLPPIILESAYSLYDQVFFNNMGTILLFAIVGTSMNIILIGASLLGMSRLFPFHGLEALDAFIFSTLISAVDPVAVLSIFHELKVNKALYFLVFDAVVITVYNVLTALFTMKSIGTEYLVKGVLKFFVVTIGAFIIGLVFGALTVLATRFTRNAKVTEAITFIVLAYLSYVIAELFHFSGIIALIVCGLMQQAYAQYNISSKSNASVKLFVQTMSTMSETMIFLLLGRVLIIDQHVWDSAFVIFSTIFCVLFRFFSVFTLTYFANNFLQRVRPINRDEQILMAFGGLRGAIAFSLAKMLMDTNTDVTKVSQVHGMFVTTTLFIIMFTVFVMGSTTKPIVKLLRVKRQVKNMYTNFSELNLKVIETVMAAVEQIAGQRSMNYWFRYLTHFHSKYFMRWFIFGSESSSGLRKSRSHHYKDQDKETYPDAFKHIEGEFDFANIKEKMLKGYKRVDDVVVGEYKSSPCSVTIFDRTRKVPPGSCAKITEAVDRAIEMGTNVPQKPKPALVERRRKSLETLRSVPSKSPTIGSQSTKETPEITQTLITAFSKAPYYSRPGNLRHDDVRTPTHDKNDSIINIHNNSLH